MSAAHVAALIALSALACGGPRRDSDAGRDAGPTVAVLEVAARRVTITPEVPVEIVGYGVRTATEVRDPLEASVLLLRDDDTRVALVTIDLPGIHAWPAAQLRRLVASAADVPYANVVVAASHTHSAPLLGDDAWSAATMDAIAAAASDAAGDLRPATVRYGESTVGFCVNRRLVVDGVAEARPNPDGPTDERVRVVRFEASDGAPIATLVHAVCHPNVLLGVESTRVSADFPGAARDGAPTLFLQGAAGDVRPMVTDADGAFRLGTDADLERIGGALHAATEAAIAGAVPIGGNLAAAHTLVALPRRAPAGATLDAELTAIRIGALVLSTIPGEPFVEVGLDVERAVHASEPGAEVLVVGYANGYVDYIVTPEAEPFGGYEVERSLVRPEAAGEIVEALARLAAR